MENLNKLTFYKRKVNENKIIIDMNSIKQEFDIKENIKLYLFKILQITKYNSKTNKFLAYLSPLESTGLPIVRAWIPIDLIYLHKIIGSYDYIRDLEENEIYIIKERIFRIVDLINKGKNYYLISYGYLINTYKNDDANTKKESGIQDFGITENYPMKLIDGSYSEYYIYSKNLFKIIKILIKNKNPYLRDKDKIELLSYKIFKNIKFKKIPEKFYID